jgi:hypothetical protein
MIISIHIRKCAGTTFRKCLANYYGDKVFFDYGDEVGSTWPSSIKKRQLSLAHSIQNQTKTQLDFDVIHGHFYRDKYDFLGPERRYITFLRDPISRTLSNYFYLKRNLDRANPDALIVNKLGFSLREYIQHPDCRNLQSQYLKTTTLDEFEFVGITEEYNSSINRLNSALGLQLKTTDAENVNEKAANDYDITPDILNLIKNCNSDDLRLYDLALNRLHK